MSSNNEALSEFDTTAPLTIDQLPPHDRNVSVNSNGEIVVTQSDDVERNLGSFLIAQAVYVVGGYINPAGRAVIVLSDDQEIEIGKVTADQVVQMKTVGDGYFTGHEGDTLSFTPLTTPIGVVLQNSVIKKLPHFFNLSKYSLFNDASAGPSGRYYVADNLRALKPTNINNLNLAMDGSYVILPPGRYYLSGFTQSYTADITVAKIVNKAGGWLLWGHSLMGGTYQSAQQPTCPAFVRGEILITQETKIGLALNCSGAQTHTYNWGLGLSWSTLTTNNPANVWSQLEVWRID